MRIRILPVLFATGLALAACSAKAPAPTVGAPVSQAPATTAAAPTAAATTAATTAAAGGKLTLDLVKQQVGPVFAQDPDCPKGEWVTDKANIDDKYRANVTDFGEYDCHLVAGETIPHRVAQAIFLTFTDARSANDYSDNELGMVPALIDGTTVVVIGAGLKTVDMRKTLRSIENACSCGHVT